MFRYRWFEGLVIFAGIGLLALGIRFPSVTHSRSINVQFVTYSQAGLPEQDVFVDPYDPRDDMPAGSSHPFEPHNPRDAIPSNFIEPRDVFHPEVVRVQPGDAERPAFRAKMLYASNSPVPHDPFQFDPHALGPFRKGDTLDLTLAQWHAARGSGTYTVNGDKADLDLSFQHLVPLGSYSLWCGRETLSPQYAEVAHPCGAANGSQNTFKADVQGNAAFHLQMNTLGESTAAARTVLTLEYDRDVSMWNEEMGGYGWNNHAQLIFELPVHSNSIGLADVFSVASSALTQRLNSY